MADKKINLEINYNSDLSPLDKDLKKIESFRKKVENLEISIPVSLDLTKLEKQGVSAGVNLAKSISKGLSSAGASIGKGVKLVDSDSISDVAQAAESVGGVIKRVVTDSKEGAKRVTSEVKQLQQGLKQITKVTTVKKSDGSVKKSQEVTTEDVRNITDFNNQLRGINSFRGEDFAKALKLKDAVSQMEILASRADQLKTLLSTSSNTLGGTKEFERGIDQKRKLDERISSTGAGSTRSKDLAGFNSAVKQVNSISGKGLGKALELKDTNAEMKILGDQALELTKILNVVGRQGLGDTAEFKKVENQIERIDQRLVRLSTGGSIKKFEQDIASVRKEFSSLLGKAEGSSALDQIDVLTKKASKLRRLLNDGESRGLLNTGAFKAADRELTSINAKIEKLNASSKRKGFGDASSKRIEIIERERDAALKINKIEEAKVKSIANATSREKALNAVYEKRLKILQESLVRFNKVGKAALRVGRQDVVDKADRRVASDNNSINQIELDRTRNQSSKKRNSRERDLSNRITVVRDSLKHELAILEVNTKQQKVGKDLSQIEKIQRDALVRKTAIYNDHIDRLQKISSLARRQGFDGVANRASAGSRSIQTSAVKSSQASLKQSGSVVSKVTGLFNKGGKAIDFHSGSLLRNAKTFGRWYIAGRLALGVITSLTSGVEAAVRVDRQFATLQAVFQGTASEAQKLKKETLSLAVANGRSSDEALDASVRFSRLGLTRVQVLKAVETSLVAANVAEVSAAEAAEKLSAIYASFKLTVDDLPEVLNRLNAISNRYNVTNKDLFEGISRVAGIAKQAGLELTDLEGIIGAVTGVTGRPGQEVGNALKFVISRIRKPQTLEKLKETFGIDLRDATGNIKQFSDILDELATVYPTLTTSQQGYFLDLTAGSRQSARFAEVLNEYTTAQSLSAQAAFDNGSAYRENDKILNSLDAQLKRVVASWDQLFVAIGDTGLIDLVGKAFNNLANEIQNAAAYVDEFEASIDRANKVEVKVTGRAALSASRTIQANESLLPSNVARFTASDESSVKDLRKQLSLLNQAKSALDTGGVFAEATAALGRAGSVVTFGALGFESTVNGALGIQDGTGFDSIAVRDLTARGSDEVNLAIKETREALKELDKKRDAARVDSLSRDFSQLTSRLKGVDKAVEVFDRLNTDLKNGSKTRGQFIRDWDIASQLLFNLDKGSVVFANNFSKVRSQLQKSDFKGAAESTAGFANDFKELRPSLEENFLLAEVEQSEKLEDELIKVQTQIDNTAKALGGVEIGSSGYKKLNTELTNLIARQKEFQDSLLSVKSVFEEKVNPGINGKQLNNVKETLDQAFKISEALGESLEGSLNSGADRDFKRSLAVLEIQRELAKGIVQGTSQRAGDEILNARFNEVDESSLAEVVDREKSLVAAAVARRNEVEKNINLRIKELELQRQTKQIEEAREEGVRQANSQAASFNFGLTETDRLSNRANGLATDIESQSIFSDFSDQDAPTLELNRANILQKEKLIKADINALEQRGFTIQAQKVQKSLELVDNLKKQTEEASKQLALASREDQLRAARLSGAIQNRGAGLTNDEFGFLSQASRQNANQFNPDAAPGLNQVRSENERQTRRLAIEQGKLSAVLLPLLDRFATLSGIVDGINTKLPSGADGSSGGVKVPVLQDSLNGGKNVFGLTLGDVNFQADLSEHIGTLADIILPRLDAKIKNEFANLKSAIELELPVDPVPFTNPAEGISQ